MQLTVDDSVAQELITAGAAGGLGVRCMRGAHTITRWLGADADPKPWSDSSVRTITIDGPGVLLVCTDGLWNYLPEAADIARICGGYRARPRRRAHWSTTRCSAGGHDNITVAVIPIGGSS